MKIVIIYLFCCCSLNAENNSTCLNKLNQLNELKLQQVSVFEKTVSYIFSNNITVFLKSKDKKILEQKIRVLEIELKSCEK